MDDTLLFIPPCCADSKLPRAVMQAPSRVLTFYTHGDVTFERFYRAISHIVVDAHVMVLSMPLVTNDVALFLQLCFERKWITHLVLSTYHSCDRLIEKHLSAYKDRMLYVRSDDAGEMASHMVLYNKDRSLVLTGLMLDRPRLDVRLMCYTLTFYPSHALSSTQQDWGNALRNALFPDVLRHRKEQFAHGIKRMDDRELDKFLHLEFPPLHD